MTRFSDFHELAAEGLTVLNWRHRLIDPDGAIVASTSAADGGILWGAELRPLGFDNKAISNRTAQLTTPITDLDLVPDTDGALHPEGGHRVTIEAGLVVDGVEMWETQGTMMVDDTTIDDAGTVTGVVNLVEPTAPIRSNFEAGFAFQEGELVSDVVDRILGQVIDGDYVVAPSSFTVPSGSLNPGDPRERILTELLNGIGHEFTATAEGVPITRPILPSADDTALEVWRYGQADGIPIERARRVTTRRTPQAWRVEGGAFSSGNRPITYTVYDTDPTSAGYFNPNGRPAQIQTLRAPFITAVSQAAEAGYGQLRRYGTGPMIVEIWSTPNPGIREGDLVDLYRPNIKAEGRFRVIGYDLPLQVDGLMRLVLRKVFDPSDGFVLPNPDVQGCEISASDDFNRQVPNLEDLPPNQPGSPEWEEVGISWGIESFNGQRVAEQRYGGTSGSYGGWCIGMRKLPMCSSHQIVSMDIVDTPSGTVVGPLCRSTGQFDGYAFLYRTSGLISLERWQSGRSVATLASRSWGAGVVGSTMTITAQGRNISAKIDGTELLAVTDDASVGCHTGMLGKGGYHPNGPKCSLFTATAV